MFKAAAPKRKKNTLLGLFFLLTCNTIYATDLTVYTENFPPYSYIENGVVTGLATEKVELFLEKSGLSYDIQLLPWTRSFKLVQKPETGNALIYSITRTQDRENSFHWLVKLSKSKLQLFSRLSSPSIIESDIPNSNYTAVCVYEDASCGWLKSLGFTSSRLELVSDIETSSEIQMVLNGNINFFAANPISIRHRMLRLGIPFDQLKSQPVFREGKGLYLAAGKGINPKILKRLKDTVKDFKKQGISLHID